MGSLPSQGRWGNSSRGPIPQVTFRVMLTFPEEIRGPCVSSWGWYALDECPIRWGGVGHLTQPAQALGGREGAGKNS